MITRKDLEMTAAAITAAADRINLRRRYEVQEGSNVQGINYKLLEFDASFTHPTVTDIATTRLGALRYLEGFQAALEGIHRYLRLDRCIEVRDADAATARDA